MHSQKFPNHLFAPLLEALWSLKQTVNYLIVNYVLTGLDKYVIKGAIKK